MYHPIRPPAKIVNALTIMDVKLVARTLDLFELFGAQKKALSLTELSRLLEIPPSSCFSMVKTLVNRGYLYEIRRRGGYYPTRRLETVAGEIGAVDPIVEMLHPFVVELRDRTGETAVLGKLTGSSVVYLDVVESTKPIRYSAKIGELRPLHANSIGKAIYAELPEEVRSATVAGTTFQQFTSTTVADEAALARQVSRMKKQGYFANFGESAPELSAIALPFTISGDYFGLSVVGPTERIKGDVASLVKSLQTVRSQMEAFDSDPAGKQIAPHGSRPRAQKKVRSNSERASVSLK